VTKDEQAAARARCEAATQGPWQNGSGRFVYRPGAGEQALHLGPLSDVDFIAHARTDLPTALDHIDALEAENARLKRENEALKATIESTERLYRNRWDNAYRIFGPRDE